MDVGKIKIRGCEQYACDICSGLLSAIVWVSRWHSNGLGIGRWRGASVPCQRLSDNVERISTRTGRGGGGGIVVTWRDVLQKRRSVPARLR